MSEALSTMSLRKVFRFPFQDTKWVSRFLVGTVLILANYIIPIIPGIFVSGYILRVMRQTVAGEEPLLPAWEDWGELLKDGLSVWLVSLVYFLPGLLVLFGGMGLYFAGSLYLPLSMAVSTNPEEMVAILPMIMFGSMAIMFISMLLGMILFALGAIALPVALSHFIATGELIAAFRLRQWWRILKADKLGYFISWVIIAGLLGILYMVTTLAYFTIVLCCLIPILAAPISLYVLLVGAALFGQTYRESASQLAAQEPMADIKLFVEPEPESKPGL